MSLFDILIWLFILTFTFGFFANSNKTPRPHTKAKLAKLTVKYTDEFIFIKRNYAYEIHSIDEWCDFLESSDYARNKYRYYYGKFLDYIVSHNSEDLELMIEDRKRFFTEHNDGSKWFKNILKDYDRQIKLLKNRLENAEMQLLYYFIRGALGGKSKIAQEYGELAMETLKNFMERTGDSKNYHPDFDSEIMKRPGLFQEGVFKEVEFP
jgi:hypothetical protein